MCGGGYGAGQGGRGRSLGAGPWPAPSLVGYGAMDLKDRVALVAGGTGTLGIAIARALAAAGAHVGISYLERKDAAPETCAAVEAPGTTPWTTPLAPPPP